MKALTSATTKLFFINLWVCLTHTSGDNVPLNILILSMYVVNGGWGVGLCAQKLLLILL
jgi:hypothetical protein